jgi:hypothetical protein
MNNVGLPIGDDLIDAAHERGITGILVKRVTIGAPNLLENSTGRAGDELARDSRHGTTSRSRREISHDSDLNTVLGNARPYVKVANLDAVNRRVGRIADDDQ